MWEWEQKDIEFILEHLERPEDLLEDNFREWLDEKGHAELFDKVMSYREALLRLEKGGAIDSGHEWKRFEVKMQPSKWRVLRKLYAVAACLFIFLLVGVLWKTSEPTVLQVADKAELIGKRSAELILADGQRIDLEMQTINLEEQNGVSISNTTDSFLAYSGDTSVEESDSAEQMIYNTLKVPVGADYKLRLADGTTIWLNCGTEIHYPVKFGKQERRVYLDGEAFFEVEKAAEWPFIVETERMHVQVTGTRFNVKSYRSEEIVHTTLVSGSVNINTPDEDEQIVRLLPSQQFCLDKRTGQVVVSEVDTRLYTDWTEGMFVFRKQRLEEVMNTLARWYGIEVFYIGSTVKDLRVSANLGRYEHIDAILRIIGAMDKVNAERKGNVVTISRR